MQSLIQIFNNVLEDYGVKLQEEIAKEELLSILSKRESSFLNTNNTDEEIRLDFIDSFAEEIIQCYLNRNADEELVDLVESNEIELINIKLEEAKLLKQAIRNVEREELKQLFEETETDESEDDKYILQAIRNIERRKLKSYLSSLDRAEGRGGAKIISLRQVLSYAAVLLLLLVPAYFLLFNNGEGTVSPEIAQNDQHIEDNYGNDPSIPADTLDTLNFQLPDPVTFNREELIISQDYSGFAAGESKVKIKVVELSGQVNYLKTVLEKEIGMAGRGPSYQKYATQLKTIQALDKTFEWKVIRKGNSELTLFSDNFIKRSVPIKLIEPDCVDEWNNSQEYSMLVQIGERYFGFDATEKKGRLTEVDVELEEDCLDQMNY